MRDDRLYLYVGEDGSLTKDLGTGRGINLPISFLRRENCYRMARTTWLSTPRVRLGILDLENDPPTPSFSTSTKSLASRRLSRAERIFVAGRMPFTLDIEDGMFREAVGRSLPVAISI
jgi:hypothetical protein